MSYNDLPSRVIPGGAHTYSKGDDQFPAIAPRFLERGQGVRVWDDRGTEYLDWMMGLRTMTLGYSQEEVITAAIDQLHKGSNFGRPSRIEAETASDLIELIPSAEMVKFAKNGSTVTTAAIKLARAYTGRDLVALCSDHPFFSYDDWAIGVTACNAGIPEAVRNLTVTFRYNDIASVERLFQQYPDGLAALIMEPATTEEPRDGFLQKVQQLCRKHGTVFILDEMITGFRMHLRGAQALFDVQPDLSTFGKGLANGFSVAALVGRRDIMDLGGLTPGNRRVFLVSTTHGAENHALAAARTCLRIYRQDPVVEHIWTIGRSLMEGFNATACEAGVGELIKMYGFPCNPVFACHDLEGNVSLPMRTLFLQEMTRRGILINYVVPSYAHRQADVEQTLLAMRAALDVYSQALINGWERYLVGDVIKPVFREMN
jgi:glutamate-1-semialdehyde 2,1-aminomutase